MWAKFITWFKQLDDVQQGEYGGIAILGVVIFSIWLLVVAGTVGAQEPEREPDLVDYWNEQVPVDRCYMQARLVFEGIGIYAQSMEVDKFFEEHEEVMINTGQRLGPYNERERDYLKVYWQLGYDKGKFHGDEHGRSAVIIDWGKEQADIFFEMCVHTENLKDMHRSPGAGGGTDASISNGRMVKVQSQELHRGQIKYDQVPRTAQMCFVNNMPKYVSTCMNTIINGCINDAIGTVQSEAEFGLLAKDCIKRAQIGESKRLCEKYSAYRAYRCMPPAPVMTPEELEVFKLHD